MRYYFILQLTMDVKKQMCYTRYMPVLRFLVK